MTDLYWCFCVRACVCVWMCVYMCYLFALSSVAQMNNFYRISEALTVHWLIHTCMQRQHYYIR